MSCEVICCEVTEILKNLVENFAGKYLDKLFSFLSSKQAVLDHYLAGYFEKILEMLFRRMTVPMMGYFNQAGSALLVRFLDNMDNYSVMQIVQRLMLPHIPFSSLNDNEPDLTEEEKALRQCNWSYSPQSCEMLFERMLQLKGSGGEGGADDNSEGADVGANACADVPLHISDLLITVLQLSPPETTVISFLCLPSCTRSLLSAVVAEGKEEGAADVVEPGDAYSSAASVSLAAISVLESLNSRLFESSLPFDPAAGLSQSQLDTSSNSSFDAQQLQEERLQEQLLVQQQHLVVVHEQIDSICAELLPFVPRLRAAMQRYLHPDRSPCAPLVTQGKTAGRRLGHRGLQLVKLVESIVRLGSAAVDAAFCASGLFQTCLDLYYHFESNSLLHLSVQRILITVLESEPTQRG